MTLNFKTVIPAGILTIGAGLFTLTSLSKKESTYIPRDKADPLALASPAEAEYIRIHKNALTGNVEPDDFSRAWNTLYPIITASPDTRSVGLEWLEEGPDNVGGRTRAVLVNRLDQNIVFAGSVTGGLYKSYDRGGWWTRVTSFDDVVLTGATGTSLAISSMCQDGNGRIYVGTGYTFDWQMQNSNGIYYSDDLGTTWAQLTTTPSLISNINKLQQDPTQANRIWIAANRVYTYDPIAGLLQKHTSTANELKVSPDGQVVVFNAGNNCYVSNDAGTSFVSVVGAGPTQISSLNYRVEFGISFEKNSLGNWSIFAQAAKTSGLTEGYISNDNGVTWSKTLPANGLINPLGSQGSYANICTGIPGYPNRFFMGGLDSYQWIANPDDISTGQIEQKSMWFLDSPNPAYVHADLHEMKWDTQLKQIYIGCDGGIFRSASNAMNLFYSSNRGYNVTQFYSVAYSGRGDVMGGTQDNGTQYNDHTHSFYQSHVRVKGGDGFDCDISQIDPSVMFASVYYGDMQRSNNYGGSFGDFLSARILTYGTPGALGTAGLGPFNTVGRLYENENDPNSLDTLVIRNGSGDTILNGQTVMLQFTHRNYNLPDSISFTAAMDIFPGDSATYIVDRVQSLYAMGFTGADRGVWITRGACDFAANPIWDSIPGIFTSALIGSAESVTAIEFSADGNYMFVGTNAGDLIRVSGLNSYYGGTGGRDLTGLTVTKIGGYTGVQGIGIDPNNNDHIIVCVSGFGTSNVREILNATTAPTAAGSTGTDISGALPSMPVYDAIVHVGDPSGNTIVIGTEYGVYSTSNGGVTWTYESGGVGGGQGPGPIRVDAVRQQIRPWSAYTKNPGMIYIGTFGRGIWRTETLVSVGNDPYDESKNKPFTGNLMIYPNPANDVATLEYILSKDLNNLNMTVYAMNGQAVITQKINHASKGKNNLTINVSDFATGTYLVTLTSGKNTFTGKMIVR